MIEQNPSPLGDETNAGTTGAGSEATTTVETQEFDVDKSDNVSQIREWGKGLKKDLDSYKPAHEFVSTKFGTLDNAEIAASVYEHFAGSEFEAEKFAKLLESLSPARSKQLFEKITAGKAGEFTQKEVEKLFGGKVTQEEIRLFKQFKESGYGLGTDEDIPDALKVNADGTPKSDEEIQWLREIQKQVKTKNQTDAETKAQEEATLAAETERQVSEQVNKFANDRLKILDTEFKTLGLSDTDTDTAEAREEKSFIRQFIINGVSGAFVADPEGSMDYQAAVKHIQEGEGILARRYEARIEKGLINIFRSKALGRLLSSFTKADPNPEARPEISKSGTSTGETTQPTGIENGDDLFARLVREGKITV